MRSLHATHPALRWALLFACTLVGALTATAFVTGWAAFRGGSITASLGTVDAGKESHAVVVEVVGAGWDLGVPFPALWGQPWLAAQSEDADLFIGSSDLDTVRGYLSGSAYSFAGYAAGAWDLRPVPGDLVPERPTTAQGWLESETGRAVAIPAQDVIVIMRADAEQPVRAAMSAEFRPERAGTMLVTTAIATIVLLGASIGLVRALRPSQAASGAADD